MTIYFYGCITLDGYLATSDHNLNWLYETGTTEETTYNEFYSKIDITLMGRKTFDEIKYLPNINELYNKTTNYVFTTNKNLKQVGFEFIDEDILMFIKKLDSNANIWVIGGNTIVKPLLDNNLIDKMYIQIAPVLIGECIKLFTQESILKRFRLIKVKKYGQFAELIYEK